MNDGGWRCTATSRRRRPYTANYVNGNGNSAASCWFQANAQYGAIEVG